MTNIIPFPIKESTFRSVYEILSELSFYDMGKKKGEMVDPRHVARLAVQAFELLDDEIPDEYKDKMAWIRDEH